MTLATFEQTYFYKTELSQLCRTYGLPAYGTKAELNHYLRLYLTGTPATAIQPLRQKHATTPSAQALSLTTPLIDPSFSFNQTTRAFFAAYFGVTHFSFTKEMAALKRQAEVTQDPTLTVEDLIKLVQQPTHTSVSSLEDATYQWNQFVKDFCHSPESAAYSQKLKVAAYLWQQVKHSDQPKKYRPELLSQYAVALRSFH